MALLVWLPLNKEGLFLNQGLADVTVINNGATYDANGKIGGCYKFTPGSNNASLRMYLNKTSADIIEQSGSFSLACWFIRTGDLYNNGCGLITCNQYKNFGFGLYLRSNGGFDFMMCNENSETEWLPAFYSEINKWTHVCVTYDKITHQLSLYINGEYKASNIIKFDWKHHLNQNIYIGQGLQGGWGYTLNGSMNDVRIYDHCLSPKEVHEIAKGLVLHYPMNDEYVETTVYDCSGYCNNGTVTGSLQVVDDSPRYKKSTKIINSTISHPLCLSNNNLEWTCCAWIKPDSLSGNLFLNNFNRGNKIFHNSGGVPLLYLNSGNNDYYNYGSIVLKAKEWTHIAFVFKNSTGYKHIFINGEDRTNTNGPNQTSTPAGLPSTVTLFKGFNGQVSDYREYSTALSDDDIEELYNTSAWVANNGTMAAYELNEE